MHQSTQPGGIAKLSPVVDISLLLIFSMFGTAGLSRLTTSTEPPDAIAQKEQQSSSSVEDTSRRIAELSQRCKHLQRELDSAKSKAATLRKQIDETQECRAGLQRAEDRLREAEARGRRLQEEIDRQKTLLEELKKRHSDVAAIERSIREVDEETEKLDRQVQQVQGKNEALRKRIDKINDDLNKPNTTITVQGTPVFKAAKDRHPVYVALARGTVAPVCEPYFTKEHKMVNLGNGSYEAVTRRTRQGPGEPASRVVAPGSAFSRLLDELQRQRQRQYVALLVDSSSFETLRAVREVLRKRRVRFGWEPFEQSVLEFTLSGEMIDVE